MMNPSIVKVDLNAVSLRQAVLCADCDVISNSPHDACMVCGSRSLLPLARVLGNLAAVTGLAAHEKANQSPDLLPKVFVVRSPVAHRRRQRGHPGV